MTRTVLFGQITSTTRDPTDTILMLYIISDSKPHSHDQIMTLGNAFQPQTWKDKGKFSAPKNFN